MNITTNSVEVSPPFFHENNTTYEAPLEPMANAVTAEPLATMSPTSLMKTSNRFANRFTTTRAGPKETVGLMQSSPAGAAGLVTGPESEAISAAQNTFIYMMQTSLYHTTYNKQFSEECACGYSCTFRLGSPLCKAILDNVEKEYQKMAKRKELFMQHVQTMAPLETENTDPVPWRWENRTAVPVEERGACLFYRPMKLSTFDEHKTPICFLHENDVIDNGTVMCLQARGNECFYGNETIKAILEFDMSKRTERKSNMCDDAMKWSFLFAILAILFSFVVVVTHIMNHLIDSYKKGYTVRSAFRMAFYTVSTVALWDFFLNYGLFAALPFLDKGLTYALCVPRGGA